MARKLIDIIWDSACIISLVGLFPRFIEPNLIATTRLKLEMNRLPSSLDGLKVVQFSDLHLSNETRPSFLKKLTRKILKENPDLILFTGDFICYSQLEQKEILKEFLNSLRAKFGCFAIFGNHDYASFVSVNDEGNYDIFQKCPSPIAKGFKRLFSNFPKTRKILDKVRNIPLHEELTELLKETPFEILHNRSVEIAGGINLLGLGEYMLGRALPEEAFRTYNPLLPGIILAHNPDCIPLLSAFPGEIILSGHTHGGQINVPFVRDKFITLENPQYKRGIFQLDQKWAYVNRGVGGVMPFRLGSSPEILVLTLEKKR